MMRDSLMPVLHKGLSRACCFSRESWHQPQKVRGLDSVEIQSATGSGVVSMAIGKDGSLWAWGKSKRGQLGLGPNVTQALVPARVNALAGQQVVQVHRYY